MSLTAVAATSLLSGCSGPHSILDPASDSARIATDLWWGMFVWFGLVLVVVIALWIYAMARKPREFGADHSQKVGRRWIIGGGIILPLASMTVLLGVGIPMGHRMVLEGGEDPLRIDVTGHQFWWEVRYPDTGVVTANQLHLPAGRTVELHVSAADVIHTFWVPRLGGKIDMIPGKTNVIRLEADRPGTYHGHCAEFCGVQHAHMGLVVEAQTGDAFNTWLEARRATPEITPQHQAGVNAFKTHCARCHRVDGVSAGNAGPDLTDVASRPTLGAGALVQETDAMHHWLGAHQSVKPGNLMPSHDDIPPARLAEIADWLETLKP